MKVKPEHNERIAKMTFASVYPHYLANVEKKAELKRNFIQLLSG